jgi:hypothetical protein
VTIRRLAAILAADIVGYSRFVGVDAEGTLARLQAACGISSHRFSRATIPLCGFIARLGFAQVGTELDDADGVEHVFLRTAS